MSAHCEKCGAVWDRPCNCPFNGAYSPTISAVAALNRAQAERDEARAERDALVLAEAGEAKNLRAENLRYREALEQIIAEALHDTGEEDLADIARQALTDQEETQ